MIYVVDASVAIKWFVPENLRDAARALIDLDKTLQAPEFILAEIANVVWKKHLKGEIPADAAKDIVTGMDAYFAALRPTADLIARATDLAIALRHPVYDCLYIACAELIEGTLITADEKLVDIVRTSGEAVDVRSLRELSPHLPLRISPSKVEHIVTLWKRDRQTSETVRAALTANQKSELKIVNTRDLAPYLNSPSARQLKAFIGKLSEEERVDILALGWLGQGYSGLDWPSIHARAQERAAADANQEHLYIVSLSCYLEKGIAHLTAEYGAKISR